MHTRVIKRGLALLLLCAVLLSLSACGKTVGSYRVLKTFGEESFSIGYRLDDQVAVYVDAALRVLSADGTVHKLALEWLGADDTTIEADADALDAVGSVPRRTLIVGVSESCFPMSYADGDGFAGFDVALAQAVCERLGWQAQFQAVARNDVYVQLTSGNVDCVWGGMPLDDVNRDENGNLKPQSQQIAVSESYLKNEILLVTRADTRYSSTGRLRGETVMLDSGPQYMEALESDARLLERFGRVERVNGGAQQCFEALRMGDCAAIVTDSVALAYYTK